MINLPVTVRVKKLKLLVKDLGASSEKRYEKLSHTNQPIDIPTFLHFQAISY